MPAAQLVSALTLVLTMQLSIASAQSGRVAPISAPPSQPSKQEMEQSNARSGFVVDAQADKYIILFATSYKGTLLTVGEEAADRGRHSRIENFVEQLNKIGSQGYRLISITSGWNPKAIARLDEAQYEYTWFETTSPYFFAKTGFEKKYSELSKQGFELVSHFFISKWCKDKGPSGYDRHGAVYDDSTEDCEYKDLFLLERIRGVKRPQNHILASSAPGWRAKMGDALTEQINEHLAAGFHPTHALSKFEVLLQQAADREEISTNKIEVQVVTSSNWGGAGVRKKVNELAQKGYRLALLNNEIAVMYRERDDTSPVSYVWVNAERRDFEKELAKLEQRGAVYRMTYPNNRGTETQLVFEQRLDKEARRREYRVLKIEFEQVEDEIGKRVNIELTRKSKETIRKMNEMVREGYEVRDLFFAKEFRIILER